MKFLCLLTAVALAIAAKENPLSTVLDLLDDLTAKITGDGEAEAKAYHEYQEWCDDTSKNTGFAIETSTKQKEKLTAKISELTSEISVASSKIDDLAAAISTGEKNIVDSTAVANKEAADFAASEKELMETLDALSRAVGILEKEMAKNPAAFAQIDTSSMTSTIQALGAVLDAASLSSMDQKKLMVLAQSKQSSSDEDDMAGAPAAAMYRTHSSGIFDVLEDLKEKAESQLSDLRKAYTNSRHNYELLKQSLEDELAANKKAMAAQRAGRAEAQEEKATSEGNLDRTVKDLANSKSQLATCHATCLQVAADHEATVAARTEELKVIAEAKKALTDTVSGASGQTYSFVQLSSKSRNDGVAMDVVENVRKLARKTHSAALAQLASRIAAVARYGASNGEDPFAKIKGLIRDMITKLERESGAEATEKAYCDEQIAKTEFKKGELEDDISKYTSRIDRAAADSAKLKEEIKELQAELAALAKCQAEMDKIRMETHADYAKAKADLELGLSGVRKALVTLRNYYAGEASLLQDDSQLGQSMKQPSMPELHSKSGGAGGSIIDLLTVVESDFATNLAKEEMEESDAQSEYDKVSQENAVTKTLKEQDVKYKTQESKSRDATVAEYSGDRETARNQLSAVLEYYSKIKDRCIAKPETYENRRARREAEINGLKEALSILRDETALVQRKHRGSFRGSMGVF